MIGFTPVRPHHTILLPKNKLWYVQPLGNLSDSHMKTLAKEIRLRQIPGLDLSDHWEITDQSLALLQSQPSLRMLNVTRTKISDAGYHAIRRLKNLAVLMVSEKTSDRGLVAIQELKNLEDVNLDRARVTDAGLAQAAASWPKLARLDISGTAVTDAGLPALAHGPHLTQLVLNGNITDRGADALKALTALQELDISQTQITDQGLAAVAALPHLVTVYLNKSVSDRGLKELAKSPSLRTLDLTGARITDDGVKSLARLKTLQELALSQTSVGNDSLASLAKLPELRMLELSDTRVTSAGLAPLVQAKKLQILSLSWEKLSPEDLRGMSRLAQIQTIILNGVPLDEATMVKLKSLAHAAPWESTAVLEKARTAPGAAPAPDMKVLAAPVKMPAPGTPGLWMAPAPVAALARPAGISPTVMLPASSGPSAALSGTSKTPLAPVSPKLTPIPSEELAMPAKTAAGQPAVLPAASPSVLETQRLKEARLPTSPFASVPKSAGEGPAPISERVTAPPGAGKTQVESSLLQDIMRRSRPDRGGAFAGLSGMKQISLGRSTQPLNDISDADQKPNIHLQEDKPENSLGEINVDVGH